jgi:hypothetical protein
MNEGDRIGVAQLERDSVSLACCWRYLENGRPDPVY